MKGERKIILRRGGGGVYTRVSKIKRKESGTNARLVFLGGGIFGVGGKYLRKVGIEKEI